MVTVIRKLLFCAFTSLVGRGWSNAYKISPQIGCFLVDQDECPPPSKKDWIGPGPILWFFFWCILIFPSTLNEPHSGRSGWLFHPPIFKSSCHSRAHSPLSLPPWRPLPPLRLGATKRSRPRGGGGEGGFTHLHPLPLSPVPPLEFPFFSFIPPRIRFGAPFPSRGGVLMS